MSYAKRWDVVEDLRKQIAEPIEAHPMLDYVYCWSKSWAPFEIDLFGHTYSWPKYIDPASTETTFAVPNRINGARVITGLCLRVKPEEAFLDWRARFVSDDRLIIDELVVGVALGKTYTSLWPTRRFVNPILVHDSVVSFKLEPPPDAVLGPAAVKLELRGFEILSSVYPQIKEMMT
jgi:hypothetical protein